MKRKLIAFAVSGALTLGAFALYAEKPEHGQGTERAANGATRSSI